MATGQPEEQETLPREKDDVANKVHTLNLQIRRFKVSGLCTVCRATVLAFKLALQASMLVSSYDSANMPGGYGC